MQLIIILLCITVFSLWMRGSSDDRKYRFMLKKSGRDQEQIDRLKSRVTVLERILLDRDRQFRDGF